MKTIRICGGGSLGHVTAGVLAAGLRVNILTGSPELWSGGLEINTPDGEKIYGGIAAVSSSAADVVPQADIVLFCLPGFLIKNKLLEIRDFLSPSAYVGTVFSSTGFFYEALKLLPENQRLWGFQRVPYIARSLKYGHSANLLGYKSELKIAVERASEDEKEEFRALIERLFNCPTKLLGNYLEASISNSNPLLHTARLYEMFRDWRPGLSYPEQYLFYEGWTEEAAEIYIKMDEELSQLISVLPVSRDFLPGVLDYYESSDALSLSRKLSSIESFRGMKAPMKQIGKGQWIPDIESRYFVEDFGYGLRYIRDLAREYGLDLPTVEKVYNWGMNYVKC